MSELFREATPVKAIKTSEGFIEITALTELDDIVGGLVSADEFFFELDEETPVASVSQPVRTNSY